MCYKAYKFCNIYMCTFECYDWLGHVRYICISVTELYFRFKRSAVGFILVKRDLISFLYFDYMLKAPCTMYSLFCSILLNHSSLKPRADFSCYHIIFLLVPNIIFTVLFKIYVVTQCELPAKFRNFNKQSWLSSISTACSEN